jgi:hypothetical protein
MHPWAANPWVEKNPGPFRIGDRVSFQMPGRRQEGVIVEDRGNLGHGGIRIYGLRVRQDEWNEIYTEIPVDELELVERAPVENHKKKK